MKQKFFGIGLGRTGTTSLCRAFSMLNFQSVHCPTRAQFKNLDRFDFLANLPICCYYKKLDQQFPGSKFIYTIREMEPWLASCESHAKRVAASVSSATDWEWERFELLGIANADFSADVQGFRDGYREAYLRHDRDVRNYFHDRAKDLLVLDICKGEGWNQLLPFIGISTGVQVPFPRENEGHDGNDASDARVTAHDFSV